MSDFSNYLNYKIAKKNSDIQLHTVYVTLKLFSVSFVLLQALTHQILTTTLKQMNELINE